MIFIGSACHSADTFLKRFLIDPSIIKEHYVPFVQSYKVDSANI